MENNAQDNELREREQQQSANEDLDLLLDSIDTEFTELWDTFLPEESVLEDVALKDNGELAELKSELSEEVDSEFDLETGENSAGSSTEIEYKEEDSKTEMSTLVDDNGEDGKMTVEKETVSSDTEDPPPKKGMGNDLASIMSNKIEEVVTRLVEKRMSAIARQPSKDPPYDHKLESALERQGEADSKKTNLDTSTDELAVLMSMRIEAIVTRLLEKQMPAIAERIILERMKKILLSVE